MTPGIVLQLTSPLPDLGTEAGGIALCWRPAANETAIFLLENGLLLPLSWQAFHAVGHVSGFSDTAAEDLSAVELPLLPQAERRTLFYGAYSGRRASDDTNL
jgi:hypothetical protein